MGSVTFRQVHKSFPNPASPTGGLSHVIQGLDLEIKDGEFMVFIGPSGCGKSTTLRMIAGLESPSAGELLIDGKSMSHVAPADRGVAMVFQSYALYPHMTVSENMSFALKMAGIAQKERRAQVGQVAEILQITHLLDRLPKDLSGGQRQRVAIGRAIVRKPKVFLFDEPLSNLDASLRVSMRIELSRLHKELGTTMVYVTHDQVEAMTLGQRIAVFNQGHLEQVGPPLELYDEPSNEFVAGFLGSPKINLIERPPNSQDIPPDSPYLLLWKNLTQNVYSEPKKIGVRAEHWLVSTSGTGIPCELILSEHLGDSSLLHLKVDGIQDLITARLTGNALEERYLWTPGRRLGLEVMPAKGLAFGH